MPIKLSIEIDIKSGMKEIDKFIKNLNTLQGDSVDYGYFDGKIHQPERGKGEIEEAELMYVLEYGSRNENIPARPVFKRTAESFMDISNNKLFLKPVRDFMFNSLKGKPNSEIMLQEIGRIAKERTQANFGANNLIGLAPNESRWAARKGRNDPLVDSGRLRDAMEVRTNTGG